MKRLLFIPLSAGLVFGTASAALSQQLGRSDASTVEQRLAEDLGAGWRTRLPAVFLGNVQNLSDIAQQGNTNKATTIQNNPGIDANQAYITQAGSQNEAYLRQDGSGNSTQIRQDGSYNTAKSGVTGNNNKTTLLQQGDNNLLERDILTTVNNTDITLKQIGNNNALTQRATDTALPPKYEVEMRGNGIKLTIEQGKIGQ